MLLVRLFSWNMSGRLPSFATCLFVRSFSLLPETCRAGCRRLLLVCLFGNLVCRCCCCCYFLLFLVISCYFLLFLVISCCCYFLLLLFLVCCLLFVVCCLFVVCYFGNDYHPPAFLLSSFQMDIIARKQKWRTHEGNSLPSKMLMSTCEHIPYTCNTNADATMKKQSNTTQRLLKSTLQVKLLHFVIQIAVQHIKWDLCIVIS